MPLGRQPSEKGMETMSKGNYEYPAWCQMETALDSYAQDRQAYLDNEASNLGPEGQRKLIKFNEAADSLAEGVQELTSVDGLDSLVELATSADFQRKKWMELLDEHICIAFGWKAMGFLSTARERFLNLLMLLSHRQPSERAK